MKAKIIGWFMGMILAAGVALAQPELEWERTFGGGNDESCNKVIQSSDGGFVLAGTTNSFGAGNTDFWLVHTNSEGDSLWSCTFGGENEDVCYSAVETSDGGFALAGYTVSFGAGSSDFWLIRTNEDGDSLWSHTYGVENQEKCNSLIQTTDGGFALAGSIGTFLNGDMAFWFLRTDEDGDSLWSRTYDYGLDDACESLIQTDDGGFILAGVTSSGPDSDFWLIRTDENGDSLWSNTYGGESGEYCFSSIQTMEEGFALAGYTDSFGSGNGDFWLVLTDTNGDSLWSQTFGGGSREFCTSIIQMADGGFALAGPTNTFREGNAGFWLVRTNSIGDSLWSSSYGVNFDICHSLIMTTDKGFVLTGNTTSFGAGNNDFYLVKTTPDPNSVRDPGSTINPLRFTLYPAYPNPFNSIVTIPFAVGARHAVPLQLAIFDPLGRRVVDLIPDGKGEFVRHYGTQRVVWNAAGFPAGPYTVRLESQGASLEQRLVLTK